MNLGDRLKLAWRIATDGKAVAMMMPTWQDGQPTYPAGNFETAVRQGWRRNELIFACVNKTAAAASFVHLNVLRRRDEEPLDDHPLRRLIARPNPFMDEFDFWQSVVIYQKLAGGAYYEKERDRAGRVIALWPLRPDWIRPVRSSSAFIGGYQYAIPGREAVMLRVEDVLDFRLFDPLNQYRGYPPAAVAGRVGDIDNATTDYLKLFMEKGGTPPGLLTSKQKLMDNDIVDIRRRWSDRYGGYEHWLSPAVLDSDATYQQIGMTFRDMGFDILDARSEARICMVLDIPPIIVGAKMGLDRSTYSNYESARTAWWEDTLVPMFRNYESVINNDLTPEFGADITAGFDFGEVPALKEAEDSKWSRANEGLARGYITINEARKQVGLEEIGEPGDIFLRPAGATEVDMNGERVNEPPALAPTNEPADEEEEEEPDTDEDLTEEAAAWLELESKAGRRAPDDTERREFEKRLRKGLEDYFNGQRERITEAIDAQYTPISKNGHGPTD